MSKGKKPKTAQYGGKKENVHKTNVTIKVRKKPRKSPSNYRNNIQYIYGRSFMKIWHLPFFYAEGEKIHKLSESLLLRVRSY